MPSFSGKFQYLDPDGRTAQAGPGHLTLEAESLTLAPDAGAPLAFDLGDIDVFAPGEYDLTLTLYTGKKLQLSHFGRVFQNLRHDLLEAYRARLVQCLLLEDLEEIARFDGVARLDSPSRPFSSPAEFRLYQSNLAVLPPGATGFLWRLADVDSVNFDDAAYAVTIQSGDERLLLTKLAKRTGEFLERLNEAIRKLNEKTANTLRGLLPFLTPDQLQQACELMKEGRAAPLSKLKTIHPKTEQALFVNVVDARLKPYFDVLLSYVPSGSLYVGFKLIRPEAAEAGGSEEEPAEEVAATTEAEEAAPSEAEEPTEEATEEVAEEEKPRILHWFFFPMATQPGARLPANIVAWEATSRSGRATYFFRLTPPERARELADPAKAPAAVEAAVRELNRAIVLLNFRREPIYLPDDSLQLQPRYRCYAIAYRKIPALRRLRQSFLGRAIHTSPQAWQKQVEAMLAKI